MGLDMYLLIDGGPDAASRLALRERLTKGGFQALWYEGGPDYSYGREDQGDCPVGDPIVAYWRKANAIHGWFVRTLADGVDECQRIDVPVDKLEDLVDRCKKVLQAHAAGGLAQTEDAAAQFDLLPVGGFFFGSTAVDGYYVEDLRDTVRQIEQLFATKGLGEATFQYQASW